MTKAKSPRPAAKPMRAVPLLLLLALALAGCSDAGDSDGETSTTGPSGTGGPSGTSGTSGTPTCSGDPGIAPQPGAVAITVASVGLYPVNPAYDPADLQVPAGAVVTVTFNNEDPNPVVSHNWVVEGIAGAASDNIGSGETVTFDFTAPLQAGEYAFYCSIGDHRDRGMEGMLSVTVA
jgi:plastocyanin